VVHPFYRVTGPPGSKFPAMGPYPFGGTRGCDSSPADFLMFETPVGFAHHLFGFPLTRFATVVDNIGGDPLRGFSSPPNSW